VSPTQINQLELNPVINEKNEILKGMSNNEGPRKRPEAGWTGAEENFFRKKPAYVPQSKPQEKTPEGKWWITLTNKIEMIHKKLWS
jgi:hypothetical protein